MKEYTNCCNCGAPLHYDDTNYGSVCKCKFCGTEYHIDRLGKVEEYKVKLMIDGEIHEFYLSTLEIFNTCQNTYRNCNGKLILPSINMKRKIELIEI